MNAKNLIGRMVLREKPIEKQVMTGGMLSFGGPSVSTMPDYSYCTDPVKIVAATDHHVVIEQTLDSVFAKDGPATKRTILDERFCDENWIDYDELVGAGCGEAIREITGKFIPCEDDPNGRYYVELPDGYRLIYDNSGYVGRYDPNIIEPV
jgi:hypothetical protein